MKRWTSLCLFGGLLALAIETPAQEAGVLASNAQACKAVANLTAPIRDQPTLEQQFRLADCIAENLYYGIGRKADLREARLCAFVDIALKNILVFGSHSVLMMTYANGDGVKRDLPLARKFACAIDSTTDELAARLRHLDAIEKAGASAARIDICDDVSGPFMLRECAAHAARLSQQARELRWVEIKRRWSAPEAAAFEQMRVRARAYFESRIENELDLQDPSRTTLAINERESLESGLIEHISRLEKGQLPSATAEQAATASTAREAALAGARAAAVATAGQQQFGPLGTIRPEGIRATDRVWARYRDAWIAFAAVRYPKVSVDAWNAWLFNEREQRLRSLYETN